MAEEINKLDAVYREYAAATKPERSELKQQLWLLMRQAATGVIGNVLKVYDPELAHDVATKAFLTLDSFRGEAKFSTWFYSLVRNSCIDRLRRDRLVQFEPLDTNEAINIEDPSTMASHRMPYLKALFEDVKETLSEEEREFLEAKLAGMGQEELGEMLKVRAKSVGRKWSELKEKIKGHFERG